MNYFELYPGDYLRDTTRLTLLEHGAYLRLLMAYYAEETPLPADESELFVIVSAVSASDKASVRKVAARFFPVGDDGLRRNGRADAEITKAQKRIETARTNGAKNKPTKNPAGNPAGNPVGNPSASQRDTQRHTQSGEALPHATCQQDQEQAPALHAADIPGAEKPKRKKRAELTFADWIRSLSDGEMAIPETDPVFKSAELAGLPDEFVALEWAWFKRKYGASTKRYLEWRQVFRNAVDGAWGSLWRPSDNGGYVLTTAGLQLQRSLSEAA